MNRAIPLPFSVSLISVCFCVCGGIIQHKRNLPSPTGKLRRALPLAWTHVPKCGGSFQNTLARLPGVCPGVPVSDTVYGTPKFGFTPFGGQDDVQCHTGMPDCCPGLMPVGDKKMGSHAFVGSSFAALYKGHGVIWLRQPEQRLISMYNFGVEYNPRVKEMVAKYNLNIASFANATAGCAVRMLTKENKFSVDPFDDHVWLGCMGVNEHLKFESSYEVSLDDVVEARKRLRGYAFVGITEEWALSICLFHTMFGGECHHSEFMDVRNQTSSSQGHDTTLLQGVVDQYDGPLYEEALSIFSSNLRHYGVAKQSCKICFNAAALK